MLLTLQVGAGLITSECLDECKHPKDYPALTNEYNKNLSNYTGSDSNYYESIVIKTEATLGYKGPDKDSSHGDKYALFQSQLNENISFEAGKVTSIPFTVPDYYQPDWINSAEASKLNSFYVDIDSANIIGDWEPDLNLDYLYGGVHTLVDQRWAIHIYLRE